MSPGPCWLELLCSYCAGTLMVDKGRSGEVVDGGCFSNGTEGGAISSCIDVVRVSVMGVAKFCSARSSDDVVNMGGVVRVNGGGGDVL